MRSADEIRLLALDTTESACSAALWYDGEVIERFEVAPRRHSELLLPMMDDLLAEAGAALTSLDAIGFARGPGSFTGLRIAASVAQGAAFGAGLPVVPVSSLQALARQICQGNRAERVLVAFDARMREVYWGAFDCVGVAPPRAIVDEAVCAPTDVVVPDGGRWQAAGSGWAAYPTELAACVGKPVELHADAHVHAADVARIAVHAFIAGAAVPAEQALPVYLRDRVAWRRS